MRFVSTSGVHLGGRARYVTSASPTQAVSMDRARARRGSASVTSTGEASYVIKVRIMYFFLFTLVSCLDIVVFKLLPLLSVEFLRNWFDRLRTRILIHGISYRFQTCHRRSTRIATYLVIIMLILQT